ncbi:phosphoglycerate mutase family domain protein [Lunatimonas lonarensis]|uniref:Phosphoglycerate mutase family domain protein n=1 Tax=Lunatimonas lonarensis TaxID=1232681 RepID=R7ZS96_9BACT|nr:histidine phosphatase family protein [Lunatimonas lonarensis]EON76923.1 phosphoglycerate mutase family domain protein [Lunatimonas lonarensis]
MKRLVLWRHAKSSWDDVFLSDHERPLAPRGIRDTPDMATRLKEKGVLPDLMVSSNAVRALETAKMAAKVFQYPEKAILASPSLYHASPHSLLKAIRQTDGGVETLFVFGHNPGMTDLIVALGSSLDNLPTCGQFGFVCSAARWQELNAHNAQFWFFDFPKSKGTNIM